MATVLVSKNRETVRPFDRLEGEKERERERNMNSSSAGKEGRVGGRNLEITRPNDKKTVEEGKKTRFVPPWKAGGVKEEGGRGCKDKGVT